MAVTAVENFAISEIPCQFFHSKQSNPTRGEKSAQAYEMQAAVKNQGVVKDVMEYHASGAGRDCYKLRGLPMVVKWFTETTNPLYRNLHPGEFAGYLRVQHTECGQHLPCQYGTRKQMVRGNSQKMQEVDCALSEFVGPTLASTLSALATRPAEEQQQRSARLFVKLLLMTERFWQSNVAWYEDFHPWNICLREGSERWLLVDLEGISEHRYTFRKAWNEAGETLLKNLSSDKGNTVMDTWCIWLRQFCVAAMTGNDVFDTFGNSTNLQNIAAALGVNLATIEAGVVFCLRILIHDIVFCS